MWYSTLHPRPCLKVRMRSSREERKHSHFGWAGLILTTASCHSHQVSELGFSSLFPPPAHRNISFLPLCRLWCKIGHVEPSLIWSNPHVFHWKMLGSARVFAPFQKQYRRVLNKINIFIRHTYRIRASISKLFATLLNEVAVSWEDTPLHFPQLLSQMNTSTFLSQKCYSLHLYQPVESSQHTGFFAASLSNLFTTTSFHIDETTCGVQKCDLDVWTHEKKTIIQLLCMILVYGLWASIFRRRRV